MPEIFFTSDLHISHSNIIKYCNRPFVSSDEMNKVLIKNINDVVGINDVLYHLGDWAFGGIQNAKIARDLIKCKNVYNIIGNHDHYKNEEDQKRFDKLFVENVPYKEIMINFIRFTMCHYPLKTWNLSSKNTKNSIRSIMIHGHEHGNLPEDKKSCILDVGVDIYYEGVHNRFNPFSISEIFAIIKNKEIQENEYKKRI